MKKKRVMSLLLAAVILLQLCACGQSADQKTAETHTVQDQVGNTVSVPNTPQRVVILSTVPLASVYTMMTGEADTIVGMTPASKNAAQHSFLQKLRDFSQVESGFAQGDGINLEAVAALEPDVLFYNTANAMDAQAAAQLTEMGYPCIGFDTNISKTGDTVETFAAWAELMGQILGKETRAKELADYGNAVKERIRQAVSDVDTPKRVLILNNYTGTTLLAAGNTFGTFWLSSCGAENVAAEISKPASPVDLEQIYRWDPEMILLNSFSAYTPEDILQSKAGEGQDWSGLAAVRAGQVFKFPLGVYYWFAPCSDSPLALLWVAKTVYPERFSEVDLEAEIRQYYRQYYGMELTQRDLDTLFNPPREAAMG